MSARNIFTTLTLLLTISASVAVQPVAASYGSTSESKPSAPICEAEKPGTPVLYQPGHKLLPRTSKIGQVILNWTKTARATKYTIAYGLTPHNYIYGAANVGNTDTRSFLVKALKPAQKYFFAVRAVNDCTPGDFSNEWSVKAPGKATAVVRTYRVQSTAPSNR